MNPEPQEQSSAAGLQRPYGMPAIVKCTVLGKAAGAFDSSCQRSFSAWRALSDLVLPCVRRLAGDRRTDLERSWVTCGDVSARPRPRHAGPPSEPGLQQPYGSIVYRSDLSRSVSFSAHRGSPATAYRVFAVSKSRYSLGMPPKRCMMHKGVAFVVEPADVPGLFRFQFRIAGKDIQGRVTTSLAGMAIKRARSEIDRRLRVQRANGNPSRPRRGSAPQGIDNLR